VLSGLVLMMAKKESRNKIDETNKGETAGKLNQRPI